MIVKFYDQVEDEKLKFAVIAARVHAFGPIDSEMEKIVLTADLPTQWTYPQIQPKLLAELERRGVIQ